MKKIFRKIIQCYLRFLTKLVLWRHKPLTIAVAGTVDKTFVKEMILEELGRGKLVRGNPRSFNTEIGLPLAVLFLPSGYSSIFKWVDVLLTGTSISIFSRKFPEVLVLEMGIDRRGDMRYLLSMVRPTIAVVTRIDRSFPDTNTSMDDIADEIKLLVEAIPERGAVILNGEDQRVRNLARYSKAKSIIYGTSKNCNAKITGIEVSETGQSFQLRLGKDKFNIKTERFGRHNLNALAAAKIVAMETRRLGGPINLKRQKSGNFK